MSFTTAALIAAWATLALFALALAGVLRQVRGLSEQRAARFGHLGPPIGAPAPPVNGREVYGRGRWVFLFFVDAECATCEATIREVEQVAQRGKRDQDFLALFAGGGSGFRGEGVAVLEDQTSTFDAFRIAATPFAVSVTPEGIVSNAAAIGSPAAVQRFIANTPTKEFVGDRVSS